MKSLYMHTINRRPAEFHNGKVVFSGWRVSRLATSLQQIRREQKLSDEFYRRAGEPMGPGDMGYVIIAGNALETERGQP